MIYPARITRCGVCRGAGLPILVENGEQRSRSAGRSVVEVDVIIPDNNGERPAEDCPLAQPKGG
jgi:hypothetical protein